MHIKVLTALQVSYIPWFATVADLAKMAKTIICVLALIAATIAAPVDEGLQVPAKTQVVAQLEVKPATIAQEKVQNVQPQEQSNEQQIQEQIQQRVEQQEQQQEEEEEIQNAPEYIPGPVEAVVGPNGEEQSEDKSDLEGANTFWGWRKRWGGWGGWGGYYYPKYYYPRHYGWGHGYGRGYGHYGGYYWR